MGSAAPPGRMGSGADPRRGLVEARRLRVRVGALAALAAALLVQTVAANGWLYEVYAAFAVLLTALVAVEVVAAAVSGKAAAVRYVVLGFMCGVVILVAIRRVGPDPFMTHSFERATVDDPTDAPTYFTSDDHAVVAPVLASLADDAHPVTVQFVPGGEGLLFEAERRSGLRYVQPSFRKSRADAVLLHDSASLPPYVHDLELYGALIANEALGKTRSDASSARATGPNPGCSTRGRSRTSDGVSASVRPAEALHGFDSRRPLGYALTYASARSCASDVSPARDQLSTSRASASWASAPCGSSRCAVAKAWAASRGRPS